MYSKGEFNISKTVKDPWDVGIRVGVCVFIQALLDTTKLNKEVSRLEIPHFEFLWFITLRKRHHISQITL